MVRVLQTEKKEKGKVSILFDNGITCQLYRTELACLKSEAIHIEDNRALDEQQFHYIMNEVVGKRATKRAMHLLEQMDRSEYQLREKLEQNGYPSECIDNAVAYVKKFHYLDDRRFACHFIRCKKDKMSRRQLEQKLAQKGIRRADICAALEEEYPEEAADRIEEEQISLLLQKRNYDPTERDEKEFRRTFAFLQRRGFAGNTILRQMKQP